MRCFNLAPVPFRSSQYFIKNPRAGMRTGKRLTCPIRQVGWRSRLARAMAPPPAQIRSQGRTNVGNMSHSNRPDLHSLYKVYVEDI
ncbi:hypothetical protein C8Q77DRAFT_430114 [Trametes polyzona]|nr:hypothetical protein C8Q77DRAFT_430114 [Trametes polyzona]